MGIENMGRSPLKGIGDTYEDVGHIQGGIIYTKIYMGTRDTYKDLVHTWKLGILTTMEDIYRTRYIRGREINLGTGDTFGDWGPIQD